MRKISLTISPALKFSDSLNQYILIKCITDKSVINIIPCKNNIIYEITSICTNTSLLTSSIAESLSDFFLTEYRRSFMMDYANKKAESFSKEEFDYLRTRLLKLIGTQNNTKEFLIDEITLVLNEYNAFSIDGFFKFRMTKEQSIWRCAVDMIADDIMIEREYDNFIELMKVFLDVQVPKADIVHVFVHNGILKIFDEHLVAYDTHHLKEIAVDMTKAPVCEDDLTVSILLALAPRVIVIHNDGNDEPPALKTIRKVFEERICSN